MTSREDDAEYKVEPFSLDRFLLFKQLSESAFGTSLTLTGFKKKYDTKKIFGHEVIGFFAIHSPTKTPAAFYGVFPVWLLIDGKKVLAAQSGDTMTHALHRKKGLFKKLALITYEKCREQNILLLFGQPNKNSYHGLTQSLNWTHLDDIARYDLKLPIKTIPFPKLFKKAGIFETYLKYAKAYLKKNIVPGLSEFTNPLGSSNGRVLRNMDYLHYKTGTDKIFIKVSNSILWVKFTDVLWIGDINNYLSPDPKLVLKLKKLAFVLGYNTITFHSNMNLPVAFLSNFKKHSTEPSCFLYLDGEYNNSNLVLTGCDFDTW